MKVTQHLLRQLGVSFVAEKGGIQEYRLNANSLKILLAPDPGARVVAVVQHVNVGSRHEGAGNTGYSHLLEHMLFFGTPKHPVGSGHSYDDFMKRHGGEYNATTSNDRTNYYAKLPSAALGAYLEYEADRLRNAIITDADLATEMPVVVDEFDIGENEPDEVLAKKLMATMFTEHPYKVETIGSRSEVLKVTAASLKEKLYDVYYHPNNTTLIIVGGFEVEEALQLVVQHYGNIPPSSRPIPAMYTVEPPQFGEQRFVVRKPGDLPRVMIGFHTPAADHEDHPALQALATILGGGESSRLYRKLVNKGLAQVTYADGSPTHDPGAFRVYARVTPGVKQERVERLLLREIEALTKRPVTAAELKRAKTQNRAGTVNIKADKLKFASSISEAEAVADWQWGEHFDEAFDALTAEQLLAVARKYFVASNRTIGWFVPTEAPADEPNGDGDDKSTEPSGDGTSNGSDSPSDGGKPTDGGSPATGGAPTFAESVRKVVLENGLTVLLQPTKSDGAFGVSLNIRAGRGYAPVDKRIVANMVAMSLTDGSKKYSKTRIADLSSEMLVRLDFNSQAFSSQMSTHVVPSDLPRFLDLLSDVVQHPTFAQAELDMLKTYLGAMLQTESQTPGARASVALSQSFFAPDSPHFVATVEERAKQLAGITADDLRAFHSRYYSPKGAVLSLVGNFDADEVLKTIKAKFGTWSGEDVPAPQSVTFASAAKRDVRIHIEGKDNLTILVGVPAEVAATSPDFVAAMLANKALGGDTLNSRLGKEIRVKRGLTYGITSDFADPTVTGGLWVVRMTTNAEKVEKALPLIADVVNTYVRDGISTAELESEREALRNWFTLMLDTPVNVARQLAITELNGGGFTRLDAFDANVAALTKDAVNEAMRKYFRLADAVTVVAGSLPEA
jgi:zinc protease